MKTPVLATGLNGLVGSKFKDLYQDKYQFLTLDVSDPKNPIDITDLEQVKQAFTQSKAEVVVHLAAYTNVTGAWEQTGDKAGLAYQVNVKGTDNIVKAAQQTSKRLIHISTAYVFDGKKPEPYVESDALSPIEWYGQTKAEAEKIVQDSNLNWTILRIDQPFRSDSFPRPDLVQRIVKGLTEDSLPPQFTDHYFGPTFIDDFAKVMDWAIRTKASGVFHASSGERWTDYDFASLINQVLGLNKTVKKGSLEDYLKTINRPYQKNTALNCDKLKQQLDFKLRSIKEAVGLVKKT